MFSWHLIAAFSRYRPFGQTKIPVHSNITRSYRWHFKFIINGIYEGLPLCSFVKINLGASIVKSSTPLQLIKLISS